MIVALSCGRKWAAAVGSESLPQVLPFLGCAGHLQRLECLRRFTGSDCLISAQLRKFFVSARVRKLASIKLKFD